MTSRRELGVRLVLVASGCLAALILSELLLRVTGLGRPTPLIPHGELPAKRRPFDEFVNRREVVNRIRLNNWGFHDVERSPRTERYRILALGDSFVEGLQVDVDELFTSRIESNLSRDGAAVEVVNAGMGGAGTAYEYLLYREFFLDRIEFDEVLLFYFDGNDLANNHPVLEREVNGNHVGGKPYVDPAGRVYVRRRDGTLRQKILRWADRHSALSYTVHLALYDLKTRFRRRALNTAGASGQADESLTAEWNEAVDGTLALLSRWHAELRGRGIGFSVVVLPASGRASDTGGDHKARFLRRLERLGASDGFDVLVLDYGPRHPSEIFTYDGHQYGHYLPAGHRWVGDAVAEWLRSVGVEGRDST